MIDRSITYQSFCVLRRVSLKKGVAQEKKCVNYTYDALNRITSGIFTNTDDSSKNNQYNLKLVEYDKNGNIKKLRRSGYTNTGYDEWLDQLVYTYDSGNKLVDILEQGNHHYGFADKSNTQTGDYTYDSNGNLISDANKGITSILYNHLNLPTEIKFNNSSTKKINYTYDATGTKLRKVVNDNGSITTTEYAGNYIYENNVLQFFFQPEGYVSKETTGFKYVYQYKDHLGNIRLSYSDTNNNGTIEVTSDPLTTEIIEENNYYPFGLEHKGDNSNVSPNGNSTAQKWKYNRVELEESLGLNLYEMDFRQYDPAIGRFRGMDMLAELSYSTTPYRFAFNNPIFWADPKGLFETRKAAREYRKKLKAKYKKEHKKFRGSIKRAKDGTFYIEGSDGYLYEAGDDSWANSMDDNPNDKVIRSVLVKSYRSKKSSNTVGNLSVNGGMTHGWLHGSRGPISHSVDWDDFTYIRGGGGVTKNYGALFYKFLMDLVNTALNVASILPDLPKPNESTMEKRVRDEVKYVPKKIRLIVTYNIKPLLDSTMKVNPYITDTVYEYTRNREDSLSTIKFWKRKKYTVKVSK